jgi:hypothetical protein
MLFCRVFPKLLIWLAWTLFIMLITFSIWQPIMVLHVRPAVTADKVSWMLCNYKLSLRTRTTRILFYAGTICGVKCKILKTVAFCWTRGCIKTRRWYLRRKVYAWSLSGGKACSCKASRKPYQLWLRASHEGPLLAVRWKMLSTLWTRSMQVRWAVSETPCKTTWGDLHPLGSKLSLIRIIYI